MKAPWPRDPHTAAKHAILQRYLQAWWPIMLSRFPRATYIEGFAGPGLYAGGEDGSPVIALRALAEASAPHKRVDLIFIDEEIECVRLLTDTLRHRTPHPVRPLAQPPQVVHGKAADELLPRLDAISAWGNPIFAFLDSWGSVAVPLDVVAHFARPGCEVLVTIGRRFWRQFGMTLGPEWDAMFGSSEWRRVFEISGAPTQARFIADTYRAALASVGFAYLLDFELVDARGEHLYLIYGTTHPKGLEKMKDAIWAVDRVSGAGFRDPRLDIPDDQPSLFDELAWEPDVSALRARILQQLVSGPRTVDELKADAFATTIFKPVHCTMAVQMLVDRGLVRRDPAGGRLTGAVVVSRT